MQVGLKPNMNPPSGFFSRFGSGFRAGLQGLGAIFREGLIIYALLPAAIGLLLGLALAYGTFTLLDYWLLQGLEASGLNDYSWLSWLSPFAAVISVIVSFFVYLEIASAGGSPERNWEKATVFFLSSPRGSCLHWPARSGCIFCTACCQE